LRLSFVGGGTMAEAMIGGVLGKKISQASQIVVGEPVQERHAYLREQFGVAATASNAEAIADASMVILAIKPQIIPVVLDELRQLLSPNQTIMSIVAGITIDTLKRGLDHSAIVRVMPNTPAQVGSGMSVWTSTKDVTIEMQEATRAILNALGQEIFVPDERLLDMATALNGSGPAYVFKFIEALIDAGVYLGMPRDMARTLVIETVLGSTLLIKKTGKHPADLSDMVTSPGGTTAEALRVLEEKGFPSAIIQAVKAAYEKSRDLGSS
jgi:pyrroline-5-carboxylate reductase